MLVPPALRATFRLAAGAALTLSCSPPPEPAAPPPASAPAKPEQTPVQRGEYLVSIMACEDCHTPGGPYGAEDVSRRLAGSDLGWGGPWGTSYADNLTPEVATGIGSWSEDDFIKALRTGVRPDGTSLPPISHEVPKDLPPGVVPEGGANTSPPPSAWDVPPPPAG